METDNLAGNGICRAAILTVTVGPNKPNVLPTIPPTRAVLLLRFSETLFEALDQYACRAGQNAWRKQVDARVVDGLIATAPQMG